MKERNIYIEAKFYKMKGTHLNAPSREDMLLSRVYDTVTQEVDHTLFS